jgi:uncharacterized membrane protein (DUF106 family)
MEKLRVVLSSGVIGALIGAGIAEFFPRLFQAGVVQAVGTAINDVFSPYRNELALKYGFGGLVIGIVIGVIIALASGNSSK